MSTTNCDDVGGNSDRGNAQIECFTVILVLFIYVDSRILSFPKYESLYTCKSQRASVLSDVQFPILNSAISYFV